MTVTKYTNPIIRGMYPDPNIVHVGEYFYMVNSTFEYYPGIALSRSSDLLNWEHLPSIASEHSQADLTSAKSNEGIFAVCIRFHQGKFYVITTNFAEFKTFIITGQFNENGSIVWSNQRINIDVNGIDPDIYFDGQQTYVQFTGYLADGTKALQQVEIDIETGKILRGPQVLTKGTGGRDVEGPHIIQNKGYYYLLAAEGGTGLGHMITIFRSKNIWGPFESCPDNPIFTNRDRADEPIQNIGHGDLFQDNNDEWWLTCLGTRPANVNFQTFTNTGRETLLYPVIWDNDWPVINHGIPTQDVDLTEYPSHAKALQPQNDPDLIDDFGSIQLNPQWISLRNSLSERITLNSNSLSLTGSNFDLASVNTPSFLGLRQTELDQEFSIELDTTKSSVANGEIGLAVTINSSHYASLTVSKTSDNTFEIIKHIRVFDLEIDDHIATISSLPVEMKLINHPTTKQFVLITKDHKEYGYSTSSMHFSNEAISALNTADIFGLYALGDDSNLTIKSAKRQKLETEDK